MKNTNHTPGPWKVMADPEHKGKHPLHDCRFITTADADWFGVHCDSEDWRLENGSIICALRDQSAQKQDAALIAAAPDMLAALEDAEFLLRKAAQLSGPMQDSFKRSAEEARAAISKAKGGAL